MKVEKRKASAVPQKDTRKLNKLKIECRTPDGGAYTADNEPQAELFSATKERNVGRAARSDKAC